MSRCFRFPDKATVNQVVAKDKIYAWSHAPKGVQDLFVAQVERVVWGYKLAPLTINVPATPRVQEIQLFTVVLKGETLSETVLRTIDTAIPSPLLFEIIAGERRRYALAWKRPSEADRRKWVTGEYFYAEWMDRQGGSVELPLTLNLEALYLELLKSVVALPAHPAESIDNFVRRAEGLRSLEREVCRLETALRREKQFNRKLEYNAKLKKRYNEIEILKGSRTEAC